MTNPNMHTENIADDKITDGGELSVTTYYSPCVGIMNADGYLRVVCDAPGHYTETRVDQATLIAAGWNVTHKRRRPKRARTNLKTTEPMENSNTQKTCEPRSSGAPLPRLVRRLRNYHQQLDTHQKKREAGMLILEAAYEIERLESACNKWSEDESLHPLIHCQICGQFRCMIHACDSPPNATVEARREVPPNPSDD